MKRKNKFHSPRNNLMHFVAEFTDGGEVIWTYKRWLRRHLIWIYETKPDYEWQSDWEFMRKHPS